jgi:hypothetical protein
MIRLAHFLRHAVPPALLIAFTCLLAAPSLWAYAPRIQGLNNPTLSHSLAAASAGLAIAFPTDEFGYGASALPDTLDIWKFPSRLADKALFQTNWSVLDYTSPAGGDAGLVLANAGLPINLGLFVMRPTSTSWVQGQARSEFLGDNFYDTASATLTGITEPNAPSNIIDVLASIELGMLSLGASVGWAYDQAISATSDISGTADSDIQTKASSSVLTIRGGATIDMDPFLLDLGLILPISSYESKFSSGAGAFPTSQDDSLSAGNTAFNATARLLYSLQPELQLVALADFVSLPQNFKFSDDNTNIRVDDTGINSFGLGVGANWKRKALLVSSLLSFILGSANYTAEPLGTGNRPEDASSWNALRINLAAELPLSQIFTLRGGASGSLAWLTAENNADTGGSNFTQTQFNFSSTASAGLGVQLTPAMDLDFVLNLANFTSSFNFQTLAFRAALEINI